MYPCSLSIYDVASYVVMQCRAENCNTAVILLLMHIAITLVIPMQAAMQNMTGARHRG